MALSKRTKDIAVVALADKKAATELTTKMDQASHVIVATSASATISTDTAFIAKLKIGDVVLSHKAAANENATVVADATLPAGISDAAGYTMAIRAAL